MPCACPYLNFCPAVADVIIALWSKPVSQPPRLCRAREVRPIRFGASRADRQVEQAKVLRYRRDNAVIRRRDQRRGSARSARVADHLEHVRIVRQGFDVGNRVVCHGGLEGGLSAEKPARQSKTVARITEKKAAKRIVQCVGPAERTIHINGQRDRRFCRRKVDVAHAVNRLELRQRMSPRPDSG